MAGRYEPPLPPVPRFRMYVRPYAAKRNNGAMAYYWLTRTDRPGPGEEIVDRGEGFPAKWRIERRLKALRSGSSPDSLLAARALYVGWEFRR
jgi:hypothetical protein